MSRIISYSEWIILLIRQRGSISNRLKLKRKNQIIKMHYHRLLYPSQNGLKDRRRSKCFHKYSQYRDSKEMLFGSNQLKSNYKHPYLQFLWKKMHKVILITWLKNLLIKSRGKDLIKFLIDLLLRKVSILRGGSRIKSDF